MDTCETNQLICIRTQLSFILSNYNLIKIPSVFFPTTMETFLSKQKKLKTVFYEV